jgi:hypothetical protein
MQPIKHFCFFILSFLLVSNSFATEAINVYPTHWWVGMKSNKLQLMVHTDQDLPQSVKVAAMDCAYKKYPSLKTNIMFS